MISVSLIIPAHCADALLDRCLDAVGRLDPPPAEVIVSVDGEVAAVTARALRAGARVVSTARRSGPAVARNRGAEIAGGDVLLFVDSDVEVASDAVARVASHFHTDAKLAALFGSYDDAPAHRGFFSQARNLFHHYTHQNARENATTFWSGLGAVRTSVFSASGGFDETRDFPAMEDVELGYRLSESGQRIRLDKALQGKHGKRYTLLSLLRIDFFERSLPWSLLLLSRPGRVRNDLNLSWENRASVVLAFLAIPALAHPTLLAVILIAQAVLNRRLLDFFYRKRGLFFAAKAFFWHWSYLLCGGFGFLVAISVGNRRRGSGLEATGSRLHRLKSNR